MLAKKYRLPVQGFLRRRGEVKKTRYFLAKYFPTNNKYSRFGIIVGKRVDKSAVIRNKKKRLISSFFEKNLKEFERSDILITALPVISSLSNQEVYKELSKAFKIKDK